MRPNFAWFGLSAKGVNDNENQGESTLINFETLILSPLRLPVPPLFTTT